MMNKLIAFLLFMHKINKLLFIMIHRLFECLFIVNKIYIYGNLCIFNHYF